MRQQLVAALHGIEMHFPSTELDMKLHILVHFPDQILRAGPLWFTAMWPCGQVQRTYKVWPGFIRNRAFPEISVMNGVVLYQQTLRAREQLRQGQGFGLETEGEGEACALVMPSFVPAAEGITPPPLGNPNNCPLNLGMRISIHRHFFGSGLQLQCRIQAGIHAHSLWRPLARARLHTHLGRAQISRGVAVIGRQL
jgi:hypothetical protein